MLRLDQVSKHFGGIQALRAVSMDIELGKITGLIGPNGSGKSTLFNVITGVYAMDAGAVYLNEKRLDTRRPDIVAKQGMIRTFQIPRVAQQMTVVENLLVGPMHQQGERIPTLFNPLAQSRLRQEVSQHLTRVREVLELVSLFPLANEYAGNLSGGQLKLMTLGMALMADPKILLLDEPAAGVNPVLIRRLVGALEQMRGTGHTLVIIEHNMEFIARVCDTAYVLDNGQIVARGAPEAVSKDPAVIAAYLGTRAAAEHD
jgi:ABC-type branched-subunit amino acid transport system ATPase component